MLQRANASVRRGARMGAASLAALALLGALVGACSGGSTAAPGERLGPNKTPLACGLLTPLNAAAAKVKTSDPADPEAFAKTLAEAKVQYLDGLEKLRTELPDSMQASIDGVKVLVQTDDFAGAATARAALDDWVAENC